MESLKLSISGQFLIDLKEKDYALYKLQPTEVKGLGEALRFRGENRVLSVYTSFRCSFGGKEQKQLHQELTDNIDHYLDKLIATAPMEYQGQIEEALLNIPTCPLRIFIIEILVRCAKEKPNNFALLYQVIRNKVGGIGFTMKVERAIYLFLFFYYADEALAKAYYEKYGTYSSDIKDNLKRSPNAFIDQKIEEESFKLLLKNNMI